MSASVMFTGPVALLAVIYAHQFDGVTLSLLFHLRSAQGSNTHLSSGETFSWLAMTVLHWHERIALGYLYRNLTSPLHIAGDT